MIDTEKLELRKKAWEALGVKHSRYCELLTAGLNCNCHGQLEHIESDNGIALDALVTLRTEMNLRWELQTFGARYLIKFLGTPISEDGATPAEAIARALAAIDKSNK